MTRWWGLRPLRRHSLVVALGGLVYVTYGILEAIHGDDPLRKESLGILGNVPPHLWGTLWILVGILAVMSGRWPQTASDTWGYTALAALAALWASGYLTALVFLQAPAAITTGGALVWTLVGILWWGISGLRNPNDYPPPDGPPGHGG